MEDTKLEKAAGWVLGKLKYTVENPFHLEGRVYPSAWNHIILFIAKVLLGGRDPVDFLSSILLRSEDLFTDEDVNYMFGPIMKGE